MHGALLVSLSIYAPLVIAGCAGDAEDGSVPGAVQVSVAASEGVSIDEVQYEVTGNEITPIEGIIDTRAPGAMASVEVLGLPAGDDYLITMRATSSDESTSCEGSAAFEVRAGRRRTSR